MAGGEDVLFFYKCTFSLTILHAENEVNIEIKMLKHLQELSRVFFSPFSANMMGGGGDLTFSLQSKIIIGLKK